MSKSTGPLHPPELLAHGHLKLWPHSFCADVNRGCLDLCTYWLNRMLVTLNTMRPHSVTFCGCHFVAELLWSPHTATSKYSRTEILQLTCCLLLQSHMWIQWALSQMFVKANSRARGLNFTPVAMRLKRPVYDSDTEYVWKRMLQWHRLILHWHDAPHGAYWKGAWENDSTFLWILVMKTLFWWVCGLSW